jgi:protein-L-isoaspartate(D-aspartate) O-methyltransferase
MTHPADFRAGTAKFVDEPNSGGSRDAFATERHAMVETQLRPRGVLDPAVLHAMETVPRHEFVPPEWRPRAHEDEPLPIGEGQTISQPYIVAAMTAALRLRGTERVLEIGTGCGYQAAVLSRLAKEVFTMEFLPELASAAAERVARLGYTNIHVHCGDGSLGLPEFAPFDAILVAAAAPQVPPPLLQQLADGGCMIVPVGVADYQDLHLIERHGGTFATRRLDPCRFVPLLGRFGWKESSAR